MKLPLVMADNCRVRKFQFPYDRHIENCGDIWTDPILEMNFLKEVFVHTQWFHNEEGKTSRFRSLNYVF